MVTLRRHNILKHILDTLCECAALRNWVFSFIVSRKMHIMHACEGRTLDMEGQHAAQRRTPSHKSAFAREAARKGVQGYTFKLCSAALCPHATLIEISLYNWWQNADVIWILYTGLLLTQPVTLTRLNKLQSDSVTVTLYHTVLREEEDSVITITLNHVQCHSPGMNRSSAGLKYE